MRGRLRESEGRRWRQATRRQSRSRAPCRWQTGRRGQSCPFETLKAAAMPMHAATVAAFHKAVMPKTSGRLVSRANSLTDATNDGAQRFGDEGVAELRVHCEGAVEPSLGLVELDEFRDRGSSARPANDVDALGGLGNELTDKVLTAIGTCNAICGPRGRRSNGAQSGFHQLTINVCKLFGRHKESFLLV
eukprot:6179876-Pleurochrysis_carterae.AAC.5